MSQRTVRQQVVALCLEQPSDAEPTLGERVAALQLEERRRAAALAGEVEELQDEGGQGLDEAEVPLRAIKADSLAVLLTQVRSDLASVWPLLGLQQGEGVAEGWQVACFSSPATWATHVPG